MHDVFNKRLSPNFNEIVFTPRIGENLDGTAEEEELQQKRDVIASNQKQRSLNLTVTRDCLVTAFDPSPLTQPFDGDFVKVAEFFNQLWVILKVNIKKIFKYEPELVKARRYSMNIDRTVLSVEMLQTLLIKPF